MEHKSWLRAHWKLVLNLVTLAALGVLVYAIREQLGETLSNLGKVNAWALLLLIPVQLLNYHAQTKMYYGLFNIVGNKLDYRFLYKTALELNFVNHVFPSGGVTGISYFGVRMSDGNKITGGKATLVQIMKLGLLLVSFEVLIIFGVVALAAMGRVNDLTILTAAWLSAMLLASTISFAYIIGSRRRINSFFTGITKIINRLIQLVRWRSPETINISQAKTVFNDFHDNYATIKQSYPKLKQPFWWALVANATEVLSIYVVFIAFGELVNIGAVILAYAIANFAGAISVLPGGVGIYEGLMVAALASAGVSAAVSLPVIIMYRVLNTLIQVPPGYYFYQQALRRGEMVPGAPKHG